VTADRIPAIDTETHAFYRAFPPESGFSEDRRRLYSWQERSGDLLVAEMDHAGVEKAFLISYDGWDMPYYMDVKDAGRESFWGGADYCRRFAERYPDRLLWFVTLRDPRERFGLAPLERRLDQGAHGIKVFPGFLETNIDDPALMEAYTLVAERGRRIIFGFEDTNRPTTPTIAEVWEAFARVAAAFPDLPMQTNHMGYLDPRADEARLMFEVVAAHPNIYVSCSCLQFMWEDEHEYPFRRYLERIRALRDGCGADRIVYGTDWPWLEHLFMYPQLVEAVRRHADFLTGDEKAQFLHRNARRFLGEA
jgi:predicted TIM-barrel fold metal-dependent hydrolase